MMRLFFTYSLVVFCLLFFSACSLNSAESKMEKLAQDYQDDKINNQQMLLAMGEIFLSHEENDTIKRDYFTRMIISGYSAWALQYYLKVDNPLTETDQEIILRALQEGGLYSLGKHFEHRFDSKYQPMLAGNITIADSLENLNNVVKERRDAESYAKRSSFFASLEKPLMAQADMEKSMQLSPCNDEAVYRLSLNYINRENPDALLELFSQCVSPQAHQPEWKILFPEVAKQVIDVRNSNENDEKKIFNLANIYVNNGFIPLALRKTQELIALDSENADYLALQAFVYYRKGEKQNALDMISRAEEISGRTSRLRTMIEQLK